MMEPPRPQRPCLAPPPVQRNKPHAHFSPITRSKFSSVTSRKACGRLCPHCSPECRRPADRRGRRAVRAGSPTSSTSASANDPRPAMRRQRPPPHGRVRAAKNHMRPPAPRLPRLQGDAPAAPVTRARFPERAKLGVFGMLMHLSLDRPAARARLARNQREESRLSTGAQPVLLRPCQARAAIHPTAVRKGHCGRHSSAHTELACSAWCRKFPPACTDSREQYAPIMAEASFRQDFLIGAGLEKFSHPKPARNSGRTSVSAECDWSR